MVCSLYFTLSIVQLEWDSGNSQVAPITQILRADAQNPTFLLT